MTIRKIWLTVLNLFRIYLVIHLVRDFMQLVGIHSFISDFYHSQGIRDTNKILNLIGLQYKRWTEAPMILFELVLIKVLYKISKKQKLLLLNIEQA